MSKQGKRKITVELPKAKDLANRPSVFERLGTKKNSSAKKTVEHCRQWAQNGSCAYGKNCKFASAHTLISPSKQRAANKDSEQKRLNDDIKRLHSTVVVRSGRGSPDGELENWDQNDLEYADTDVLEKRRQQLQRELELQLKMDGKDMRKDKKKALSSSSSSRSSSSSSGSSSSSDGSTSSSSSGRDVKRKAKKGKLKRNSSSSSEDVPTKRKFVKSDLSKRDKSDPKKSNVKRDDKIMKKHEPTKKKTVTKVALGKKSLSPGKKSGGTPPITSKSITKNIKHTKSPPKRERNKSASPHLSRDKDKDRNKDRDKDREKERPRGRSRSPKKGKSRSPRRHGSHSKDPKRKASSERSRPVSPKKPARKEGSLDKHRKQSLSRDRERGREHKDRSLERRKDKHDDKERHDRKDRGRNKDNKRDDKRRGRDRGLGGRIVADKGLEKPSKPMERLLPRPEERLAALAAISNRVLETDKNSTTSKDNHSERGGRKSERLERDRSLSKRDRLGSNDREQGPREDDRSPGYGMGGRDRHYDSGYDMPGPPRGYPDDDDRIYGEHISQRGDHAYEDRRGHRDRSWEGRANSMDPDRGYMHPHKDWDNEDYRNSGEWGRDRHWQMHEPQMGEWGDKEQGIEGWHQRSGPSGSHRGRINDNYGRGMRGEGRDGNKRRGARPDPEPAPVAVTVAAAAATAPTEHDDDKPIPDDLSEISDDPDDILNREDMVDQTMDDESQSENPTDDTAVKADNSEKESTQDTSGAGDDRESQDAKDDEDVTHMDFEEISDGELEEERTRAGLGDALGVDWASLVADVRRREQASSSCGGARARWRPERLLPRLGLSLHMAGRDLVQQILATNQDNHDEPKPTEADNEEAAQNGEREQELDSSQLPVDVESLHPVAAMQVALQKRQQQRRVLFGSGCEITRGLSARRDLALRRFLCQLPPVERSRHARAAPPPALFHAARARLMHTPA